MENELLLNDIGSTDQRIACLILLGDPNVGKTKLFRTFCGHPSQQSYKPTLGVDCDSKTVSTERGDLTIHIRDPSGEHSVSYLTQRFIKQCDGVVFVYNTGSEESFQGVSYWNDLVNQICPRKPFKKFLIGNHLTHTRSIPHKTAQDFAHSIGAQLMEFTMIDPASVTQAVIYMAERSIEKENEQRENDCCCLALL